jgi:hypothetical protein
VSTRSEYTTVELLGVALGSVAPTLGLCIAGFASAGFVWLLATFPGLAYVAVAHRPIRPRPGSGRHADGPAISRRL